MKYALALATALAILPAPAQQTRVPLTIEHGVLLVRATVDGVPRLLFTLDPGAADMYTSYARERLHGRTPRTVCLSDSCFPAAMAYFDGDARGLDPRHDSRTGEIAGSIGPQLLRRYVIRVDYEAQTLTLIPPAKFEPPTGTPRLPVQIDAAGMPSVPASVDGKQASFELDLRAPTSMLFAPFLARSGLAGSYAGAPVVRRSAGLTAHAVNDVEVNGTVVRNAAFWFSTASHGKFADSDVGGLLGNNVLSHFTVTLDLPHRSAYLAPANRQMTGAAM